MKMNEFTIIPQNTIKEALLRIDQNKKGFLIVIDDKERLLGTLSDGDIRRGLIKDRQLNDSVGMIFNNKPNYVTTKDKLYDVVDVFKNPSFSFLPIVDETKKLVNVITKASLQALLIMDKPFDLNY